MFQCMCEIILDCYKQRPLGRVGGAYCSDVSYPTREMFCVDMHRIRVTLFCSSSVEISVASEQNE